MLLKSLKKSRKFNHEKYKKTMKKKNIIITLAAVLLIVLIVCMFLLKDKKLDPTDKLVTDLYSLLGEVDINKCGGLITYGDQTITENDLSIENRLCMAYLNVNNKNTQKVKSTEQNSNKINICKVGEKTIFATSDESETECEYEILNKSDLKEVYFKIYGSELVEEEKFYISDKKACFKEGEEYYCGNAETYNVSITPETTIYRIIDKVTEKLNGEIIIQDFFLKISNNKCYSKNNSEENEKCTNELKDIDLNSDKETIALVKKYGATYKHTFKKASDQHHYWFKTEVKDNYLKD